MALAAVTWAVGRLPGRPEFTAAILAVAVILGIGGLALCAGTLRFHILLDLDGFRLRPRVGRESFHPWAAVEDVQISTPQMVTRLRMRGAKADIEVPLDAWNLCHLLDRLREIGKPPPNRPSPGDAGRDLVGMGGDPGGLEGSE